MSYDVYGIGNALVDMEYVVDDTFLRDQGIPKGHMTLVDEARLIELASSLADFEPRRISGGSAANTAYAVQGFGGKAFYSYKVAGDDVGAYFVADLNQAGVATDPHDPQAEGHSGRCLVLITDDAERSMNTFLGVSEQLAASEVNPTAIRESTYVYLEGYLSSSETARAAAVQVREIAEDSRVRTSLSLSDPSMVEIFRDGLMAMLGNGVDHLFCNEEEALTWTKTDRIDIAARELADIAPHVNITLGARGSLAIHPRGQATVEGFAVKPVDTTGAGDIYAGACLWAMCEQASPNEAARFANYAAAQLVTQFGARLPDVTAYQNLRASFRA